MRMLALIMILSLGLNVAYGQQKNRLIVLTDIEADPDDTQSLVRLLLYSNEIDIEGIIATTSCWMTNVNPQSITKVIQAYEKVQPNLIIHHSDYPTGEILYPLIKSGLPTYGMKGVGEGMDSEGSEWIIKALEKKDERPLWISVWGGVNTLAQALYKIDKTKSKKEAKRLISKLRVYTISDQDDSGIWIRNNFPDLFYIVSPGDDYGSATWTAINDSNTKAADNAKVGNGWIAENLQQGHGPLGAIYPDVAWGMEGDTPAFLSLIPNGLNNAEHPDWGGWGGRYELYKPDFSKMKEGGSIVTIAPETRAIWTNAVDSYTPYIPNEFGRTVKQDATTYTDFKVTLWRWRDDFQNDFAARMDWCFMPYEEANHPPVPVLSHPEQITVKSGEGFLFDATQTTDPDGDSFSFLWFNYPEAGTYKKLIKPSSAENAHTAYFIAPEVDKEESAHFILKITDRGEPQLSRYKRIIVTIKPK